ncbi:MAG: hypothetical protein WBE34_16280 [Candidatus Nitrosopolaris sp.]
MFTAKNESDAKNVFIVSHKNQYFPISTLTRDFDEEGEVRRLREIYKK